jgi:hypothetical protein
MLKPLFLFIVFAHLLGSVSAQEIMRSLGNHKVELAGKKMRPGKALNLANSLCPMASSHFAKAKKMRTWNILISQFGATEVILGLLAIEQGKMSFGVANAAVGGIALTFFSDRDVEIQGEIEAGVKAFNRCQFFQ